MDENEVKKVEQNENINTNTNSTKKKELNIFGLISFIFSIIGFVIGGIPIGIACVVLGIIGICTFEKSKQKYKWMGIAGLCIGIVDIIGGILSIPMLI